MFKRLFFIAILVVAFIPMSGEALLCTPTVTESQPTEICNPLGTKDNGTVSNYSTFETFLVHVFQVFAGAAGIVTITYVAFSGFRFLISQGNAEEVEKAKRSLQWSISGLILIMLSYVIISALSAFLGAQPLGPDSYNNPQPQVNDPLNLGSFINLYYRMLTGFFGVMGLLAILMIIMNGFRYITARGNDEQAADAKNGLLYAIIGVVIVIMSYVIVQATANFFNR